MLKKQNYNLFDKNVMPNFLTSMNKLSVFQMNLYKLVLLLNLRLVLVDDCLTAASWRAASGKEPRSGRLA